MKIRDMLKLVKTWNERFIDNPFGNADKKMYKIGEQMDGSISLMCPRCFNYETIKIHYNVDIEYENEKYVGDEGDEYEEGLILAITERRFKIAECKICGLRDYDAIEMDPNMAKVIRILNLKGYRTNFCCEGHGSYEPYIYFHSKGNVKTDLVDFSLYKLPLSWYLDLEDFRAGRIIIRSDVTQYPDCIKDIEEFVVGLPCTSITALFNYGVSNIFSKNAISIDTVIDKAGMNIDIYKGASEPWN